jgi:hypothetical protein
MTPLSASRIYTKYTPPRRKLAQPITPSELPRQLGQYCGYQTLGWKRLRHRIQSCKQALQLVELSATVRVVRQQPVELPGLVRGSFAVEDLVHQAYQFRALHQSDPKSASNARRRCRDSNNRDFTVFSSRSRICAIAS